MKEKPSEDSLDKVALERTVSIGDMMSQLRPKRWLRSQNCDEGEKESFKKKEHPVDSLQGRARKKVIVHKI